MKNCCSRSHGRAGFQPCRARMVRLYGLVFLPAGLRLASRFRTAAFAVLLICLPQAVVYGSKQPAPPNADSIHWAAWDTVLGIVSDVAAARYSFYAYRSLAVPCPEIYLKSDALFSDIVKSIPGSQAAFHDRDPRNLELYRRLQRGEQKGPSFTWDQRSLDPSSVHDSLPGRPGVSWLDRRLPSAAVLLRTFSPRLSTLEAASLLYTQLRQTGRSDSALFVIVDSAGRGHLADGGHLISVQNALQLDDDPATIVPVLVFNERVVFYPLFGRDDRALDSALGSLVGRMASPVLPSLTLLDRVRLERLRLSAALPTRQARDWAVIAACGAFGMYNSALQKAWISCGGDTGAIGAIRERAMARTTMYWADMLSFPAAQMAALADPGSFAGVASRWQSRYLELCGRPVTIDGRKVTPEKLEAWGSLWAHELMDIPFDDIIRTRAGQGSSQSLAMSAILDMVRRPHFLLEIDPGDRTTNDQNWVIAADGNWQFNLGIWTRILDTLSAKVMFPLLTLSYSSKGRWISFGIDEIATDSDDFEVASDLTEAARVLRTATLRFRAPKNLSTSLNELMMKIEAKAIPLRPLPWPEMGTAADRP